MRTRLILIAAAMLACGFVSHARGAEPPPVFDTRPYADAKKAAETDRKWFIVKGTAEWCGPCKQMDATTWRDEKVVSWLKANAVVVALDVDKEKKLAGELNIEEMPTMIAFKDGKEFDRTVGYATPEAFLTWCQGIAKGEKAIEKIQQRAAQPQPGGKVDVDAKYSAARALVDDRKYAEAADEYVWLWDNMLKYQNSMYGVRLSFMAGDMERLAKKSSIAKQKFIAIRDRDGKLLDGEKVDTEILTDWVTLNKIVGDDEANLTWFDKVKADPRWKRLLNRESLTLAPLLVEKRRWADLPFLYSDPIAELTRSHGIMQMSSGRTPPGLDEGTRKQIEEMPARMFREGAAPLYAGLLAAGREEDAAKYADKARELDKSPKMIETLINQALEARQPRKAHLDWIDAAKSDDLKSLRDKVAAALNDPKAGGQPAKKETEEKPADKPQKKF